MVLVSTGPDGSGPASGSLRSDTFSRNRFGQYIRNKSIPVNPNTDRQGLVRSSFAFLTNRWSQDLTQVARDAWDLYGSSVVMKNRLGQDVFLTGFNHFLRSNTIRKMRAGALKDNGPTVFELPDQDPLFAITCSEAAQTFSIVYDDTLDWDNETDGYLWVFQGSPQNPQRNFFGGPWRFLGQVDGVTGAPVASPLAADAVFAIAEGQRQWCYARIGRADGRLSEPFRADILVGA